MSKPKTDPREVSFALSFLKYLGVKDPRRNAYLILAVIAWLRQESGGITRVIGNNPFNIRSSPFASGYRTSRNGNGRFALFASLDIGAKATAALLKSDGANGWRGYGAIVRAATMGGTDQQQAINFLTAIALSRWDASHYGSMVGQDSATYDGTKNHLIQLWQKLLGAPVYLPPDPKQKAPPPPKQKYSPPDDRIHSFPRPEYLRPYASYQFYVERVKPPVGLGDGKLD